MCKTQIISGNKKKGEHNLWASDKAISVDITLTKGISVVMTNRSIGRVYGMWGNVDFPDLSVLYFAVPATALLFFYISFMKYRRRRWLK